MLEDFITNEAKDTVSESYVKLYDKTTAYYALRTFNVFNRKYTEKHNLKDDDILGHLRYGERKANVFKRYVDKAIYNYNPMNDNQYTLRGK